jgi:hypothetical protein
MILCQQLMWPHLRDTHPGWFERTLAWAGLHGVGVNQLLEVPLSAETSAVAAGLRRFTEFGADPCDWIPYWQLETGGACVPSAEVKMTVYRRADGALLCMVANLTGQPQTASLDLLGSDLLRPKPGAGCVALDTGTSVPVTQGRVMLELPAYGHRQLRVE